MRLFIALELPEAVRVELVAAQERLREGGFPVRWVDAAALHLTLQFLGEADNELVAPLLAALAALPDEPIPLRLDGIGGFPSPRQPRVVWAGVGGATAALACLHAAVNAATAPLGFVAEERPFSAHLTLGRVRKDARPEQVRALGEALRAAQPPLPVAWEAGRPTLFQSELTPRGPIYTAL